MKKTTVLKSAAALVLALAMVLCLAACGGSPEGVEGSWKLKSMEIAGMTIDIDELANTACSLGIDPSSMDMSFNFKGDGTVTMSASGVTSEGTYTMSGSNVDVTFEDETQTMTLDTAAGTLTLSEPTSGAVMVFGR